MIFDFIVGWIVKFAFLMLIATIIFITGTLIQHFAGNAALAIFIIVGIILGLVSIYWQVLD